MFLGKYFESCDSDFISMNMNAGIEIRNIIIKNDEINNFFKSKDIDVEVVFLKIDKINIFFKTISGILTLKLTGVDLRVKPNLHKNASKEIKKKLTTLLNPEKSDGKTKHSLLQHGCYYEPMKVENINVPCCFCGNHTPLETNIMWYDTHNEMNVYTCKECSIERKKNNKRTNTYEKIYINQNEKTTRIPDFNFTSTKTYLNKKNTFNSRHLHGSTNNRDDANIMYATNRTNLTNIMNNTNMTYKTKFNEEKFITPNIQDIPNMQNIPNMQDTSNILNYISLNGKTYNNTSRCNPEYVQHPTNGCRELDPSRLLYNKLAYQNLNREVNACNNGSLQEHICQSSIKNMGNNNQHIFSLNDHTINNMNQMGDDCNNSNIMHVIENASFSTPCDLNNYREIKSLSISKKSTNFTNENNQNKVRNYDKWNESIKWSNLKKKEIPLDLNKMINDEEELYKRNKMNKQKQMFKSFYENNNNFNVNSTYKSKKNSLCAEQDENLLGKTRNIEKGGNISHLNPTHSDNYMYNLSCNVKDIFTLGEKEEDTKPSSSFIDLLFLKKKNVENMPVLSENKACLYSYSNSNNVV